VADPSPAQVADKLGGVRAEMVAHDDCPGERSVDPDENLRAAVRGVGA